jgi:hypothetical protein
MKLRLCPADTPRTLPSSEATLHQRTPSIR